MGIAPARATGSLAKVAVIPNSMAVSHEMVIKGPKGSLEDGFMPYQLVGEVTAHQGDDG